MLSCSKLLTSPQGLVLTARHCRWLEHDPQELLSSVHTCIAECLQTTEAEHGALRVKAVGITNQRETTLVWDRSSLKALHNAIVWPDSRTAAVCQAVQQEVGAAVSPMLAACVRRSLACTAWHR